MKPPRTSHSEVQAWRLTEVRDYLNSGRITTDELIDQLVARGRIRVLDANITYFKRDSTRGGAPYMSHLEHDLVAMLGRAMHRKLIVEIDHKQDRRHEERNVGHATVCVLTEEGYEDEAPEDTPAKL